jgi:hypothetical protein
MELSEFLQKHNLQLNQQTKKLFDAGLKIMSKSRDLVHEREHVLDILSLLDQLIQNEKSIDLSRINLDVLLPAIVWHDVWMAVKPMSSSIPKYIFERLYEGAGSARMFMQQASLIDVDRETCDQIARCVRRHSYLFTNKISLRLIKPKRLEIKILQDLDRLDLWTEKRLNQFKAAHIDENGRFRDPKMIHIARLIARMAKRLDKFHFEWSQKEFQRRRKIVVEKGRRLIEVSEK